jgi:hypothetical protein
MKKRIIFLVIALAIVSIFIISCDGNTIFGNQGNGTMPSTYSYLIKPNIEEAYGGRDLPALPIGTEIFISGQITVLDTISNEMVGLRDNESGDIISIGVVDSIETIRAIVRLNTNSIYGIAFLAHLPDGEWMKLNTIPVIYVIHDSDTTQVTLDRLYQSKTLPNHFSHGKDLFFQHYHGFGIDEVGNVYTRGPFEIDDLQELIISWDGQSNWTSNLEGTAIIPVPDSLLSLFAEPINSNMNIWIRISNNYLDYSCRLPWHEDNQRFQKTFMILPGTDSDLIGFNLRIYEAATPATIKYMGVNADNVELMNVYSYYQEDWFLARMRNGVPENIQLLDLRGTLGIIYP